MKNILSRKIKLYIGIGVVLIFSLAIIAITYSDLDEYIFIDFRPTVVAFILVFIIGLINGYIFNIYASIIMEKPTLIYNMMNTLTAQLFIFLILYFFIDGIFDNKYILIPYNLQGRSTILNLSIAFLWRSFKVKKLKFKFNLKTLMTFVLSFVLIFQMNYLELTLYGLFFGILYLSKKLDQKKIKETLVSGKKVIFIILIIIFLLAFFYVSFLTNYLALRCSYIVVLSIMCYLVYNNSKVLGRDL